MVALADEAKQCSMCQQLLPLNDSHFYGNRHHGKVYFSRDCIKCTRLRRRLRYTQKKGKDPIRLLEKQAEKEHVFSPTGENELQNAIQMAEYGCFRALNMYKTAREWRKLGIMDDESVRVILKRWTEQEKLVKMLKNTLPQSSFFINIPKNIILIS